MTGRSSLVWLLFSFEAAFGIYLEFFAGRGEFEDFDKFVRADDAIALSAAPTRRNILNAFRDENQLLVRACRGFRPVLIDETFNVKLSQHELLAAAVVTEQSPILFAYFMTHASNPAKACE